MIQFNEINTVRRDGISQNLTIVTNARSALQSESSPNVTATTLQFVLAFRACAAFCVRDSR